MSVVCKTEITKQNKKFVIPVEKSFLFKKTSDATLSLYIERLVLVNARFFLCHFNAVTRVFRALVLSKPLSCNMLPGKNKR